SEINGEVIMGKTKRGNREIVVKNKSGVEKHYLVPLSKQILVQENDYVKAGTPLSDDGISPSDILNILGPVKAQEYIVNEVQAVYRLQGVKINDKHFEIIVRQMMRKVEITHPGDTEFLQEELVDKWKFMDANDRVYGKYYVLAPGDSQKFSEGDIISARDMQTENASLERQGLKPLLTRPAQPATARLVLQGITRAALKTDSFMSAASFQETTKVLSEAAIRGRVDYLEGLKENVICGHLIPAGTGLKDYQDIIVGRTDAQEQAALNEL
ncbi:MAG: DNA-directed RNA polymerase subunit beta', partial [Bacteroidales bacterium]|nr:DNA-directed RNA polymerase subunit beta' [Bacteroidales bacterium]